MHHHEAIQIYHRSNRMTPLQEFRNKRCTISDLAECILGVRGHWLRAYLLLMEMGISSKTSRQDTSAPFSFSAVSAPAL